MKKEAIYNIVWTTRKEVEKCQKYGYFKSFPNGFCALSSIWIYDILMQYNASSNIKIRQKTPFYKNYPHTWVHCDNFDIDITADQFKELNFPKVYVGKYNTIYHHFDEITSKKVLFPTEFILKQISDNQLRDGVETLYKNLGIDVNSFYRIPPEFSAQHYLFGTQSPVPTAARNLG